MPWDNALPFGIRQTKITPFTTPAGTTLGTGQLNPNARNMSFEEAEDYEELRGDDKVVAIRGLGATVEWEMENGGINVPAFRLINGGTVATTGTTPAQVTTYTKKFTDERPYFKAEGRAISDLGGDFNVALLRARASEGVTGELADGAFWLSGASGVALPSLLTGKIDVLYEFVLNETAVPLT